MRLNVAIGGKAGQGINKISEVVSDVLNSEGYFVFDYREYSSRIRGGHNFNLLSISDKPVRSCESIIDGIIAMDEDSIKIHKKNLKKEGFVIGPRDFLDFGINLNIALSGALIKILGIDKAILMCKIKECFGEKTNKEMMGAVEKGYDSQKSVYDLKNLNNLRKSKRRISLLSGSDAVSIGAINSGIDAYFGYPMTPSTGVLHNLAAKQEKEEFIVIQPENEIAVVNMALGASFSGATVMVGTSGGGFDLMAEALSFQGISQIPLVVYLASRVGPGTGIPTYTSQGDLDVALRSGHGEFPRVVIAPGDSKEAIEKTNEALYLSNKFNCLSIILSDKHLAESRFSFDEKINKTLAVKVQRKVPGEKAIVRASGYECDKYRITTEDAGLTLKNANERLERYLEIKKECKKFGMIKIHGNKKSRNLVIGWGSTKGVICDAIEGEDFKFLQVLYLKPLSNEIKQEIEKAQRVILVENNVTGQLGRLLREKTGIKIDKRILKYNGRPFNSDELKKELLITIK